MSSETPALYAKIYYIVQQIPAGEVATYGDIALMVGGGCDARMVGVALSELGAHADEVPWQRVINREGGISTRGLLQRELLEAEGVPFNERGQAVLARCRWAGPTATWAAAHGYQTLLLRPSQLELF